MNSFPNYDWNSIPPLYFLNLFDNWHQLTSIDQLVVWPNGFSRFRCWWVFNYGFLSATDAAGTVVSQHGSGTGWELRCGGGKGLALSKSFQHYCWILFGSIRDDPKVGRLSGMGWKMCWKHQSIIIYHHNQSRLEPMFLPGHIHPYPLEISWDESSIAWCFPAPGPGVNCVFTTSRGGHNEHMLPLIPGLERHWKTIRDHTKPWSEIHMSGLIPSGKLR